MLQNVNEVNREPAHSEWCLVHVTFDQTELFCNINTIQQVILIASLFLANDKAFVKEH